MDRRVLGLAARAGLLGAMAVAVATAPARHGPGQRAVRVGPAPHPSG